MVRPRLHGDYCSHIRTEKIFRYASNTTYQLSTGKCRSLYLDDDEIYSAFWEFTDELDGEMTELIHINYINNAQYAFLNKRAFDYVMMPTHKFEAGQIDQAADEIYSLGDEDKPEAKPAAKKRPRKPTRKPTDPNSGIRPITRRIWWAQYRED